MANLHLLGASEGTSELHVILFHGLGGHPRGTWQVSEADESTLWPLWLLRDIKATAVWSVEYEAPVSRWSGRAMHLADRAENILGRLLAEPRLDSGNLILIGHSLGGLIIKQLARLLDLDARHNETARTFLHRIVRVGFLATPHTGSDLAVKGDRLRILVRPSAATLCLVRNDPNLRDLNNWYRTWASQLSIEHLVLTETKSTGVLGTVVKPDSADPALHRVRAWPTDKDHWTISKPVSIDDEVYVHLKAFISEPFRESRNSPVPSDENIRPVTAGIGLYSDHRTDFEGGGIHRRKLENYVRKGQYVSYTGQRVENELHVCYEFEYLRRQESGGPIIPINPALYWHSIPGISVLTTNSADTSAVVSAVVISVRVREELRVPWLTVEQVFVRALPPSEQPIVPEPSFTLAANEDVEATPVAFGDLLRDVPILLQIPNFLADVQSYRHITAPSRRPMDAIRTAKKKSPPSEFEKRQAALDRGALFLTFSDYAWVGFQSANVSYNIGLIPDDFVNNRFEDVHSLSELSELKSVSWATPFAHSSDECVVSDDGFHITFQLPDAIRADYMHRLQWVLYGLLTSVDRAGAKHVVRFMTRLIFKPLLSSGFMYTKDLYSIAISPNDSRDVMEIPVAQEIPGKGADHFVLRIFTEKPAHLKLDVNLRMIDSTVVFAGTLDLRTFFPQHYEMSAPENAKDPIFRVPRVGTEPIHRT